MFSLEFVSMDGPLRLAELEAHFNLRTTVLVHLEMILLWKYLSDETVQRKKTLNPAVSARGMRTVVDGEIENSEENPEDEKE